MTPSGDQTPEAALNHLVHDFLVACQFDGLPLPDEVEVREALAAKG